MKPLKIHHSIIRGITVSKTLCAFKLTNFPQSTIRSFSSWKFPYQRALPIFLPLKQIQFYRFTQHQRAVNTKNEPFKQMKTIQNHFILSKYILSTDLSIEISISKNQSRLDEPHEEDTELSQVEREEKALQKFLKENKHLGKTKYSQLLGSLIEHSRFREAYSIFRKMLQDGLELDHVMLTLYVKILGGLGKFEMIDEFHNELKTSFPGVLDHILYTAIMDSYANKKDTQKIVFYLKEMMRSGLKPNVLSFTTLLDSISFEEKEMVTQVLEKLEQYEVESDSAVYNILIAKFGRLGKFEEAVKYYEEMKSKGLEPDVFTYNSLMAMYSRKGQVAEIVNLFEEMTAKNIQPDIITFTNLFHGLIKTRKLPEALELLKKMQRTGVKPDIFIFTDLISAFGMRGDINNVIACSHLMLDFGIQPDLFAYTALIQAYGKIGDIQSVEKILRNMSKNNIIIDERGKIAVEEAYQTHKKLSAQQELHAAFTPQETHKT